MASLITVRLNKADSTNWGFRLQGGKDFGTPLVIQKVNGGSPAERAGLIAGDAVIKINNTDVFNLRHKDAQDVVVRSGASFDMTIQRGGSTWKPSVTPITTPTPSINSIAPVTKTSLASTKKENIGAIGTGHNTAAKPFNTQINGTVNGGPGPKVVNNQYNSPLKLYSEESIAETLSAQTEVLAPGVLGVNFKKNERNYDAANSAVFRMVQEAEKEPKIPEPEPDSGVVATPAAVQGLKHVTAPETKPTPTTPQLPPGQNVCADCERLIVGVFVRIKDKNLHVECFKCATCGTSLKNVGYYNVNNKLYCDIHAKLAALSNPTLSPTASVPLGKAPASAISSALSSHSIPSPSPLSPKPNSSATPFQVGNPFSPKPFSSVSAPTYKPISNSAALSPVSSIPAPNYSPVSSTGHSVQNIVWPPPQEEPEVPTACPLYFPPPSQVQVTSKRQRFDSCDNTESEVDMTEFQGSYSGFAQASGRISTVEECIETISETLNTQQLVENVLKNKLPPQSTTPPQIDKNDKSLGSKQELQLKQLTESDTNQAEGTCDLKRPVEFNPVIKQKPICAKKIDNSVPKQWESQMVQALKTIPDDDNSDPFTQIPTKRSSSALASALATAPAQPFTPYNVTLNPIPLPEETVPYFPPEHPITSVKPSDPPSEATFKKKKNPTDKFLSDLPKPQEKLTMLSALTTAPDRSYSPFTVTTTVQEESEVTEKSDSSKTETIIEKKTLQRPLKPTKLPPSFTQIVTENDPKALGCYPLFKGFSCSFENNSDLSQFKIEISTTPPIPNNPEEIDHDCFNGVESETVETVQTERVVEESQSSSSQIEKREKVEVIAKQSEDVILKKAEPLLALHKAGQLPQYQKNLSETVEADLQLMKKIEAANLRHQQQKIECTTSDFECKEVERITKPTITLHPGNAQPEVIFKPVDDEVKAQNLSFSPRPRPLTPSMINKPAPAIPYYQASLVTQQYRAPTINLLDPTSPAVSRSPSPCHERRSPSPFPNKESSIRPKSPAAGPPPNPLHSSKPLPTPRDSKMEEVKRNVSAYIPQYRSKIDGAITSQISNNSMQKKATNLQVQQFQNLQVEESNRNQVFREESKGLSSTVAISEQSHAEHLEAMKQSQCQSVENRGNVQVQRKKTVTEEFEHSQKSKVIQIEKNTTQNHAFRNINCNAITEQGVVGLHVTNPQPIVSPFLHNKPKPQAVCPESKSTDPKSCQERKSSCPNVCHIDVTLPKPPERKPCPKLDPKPSPAKPACFKPVVAPSGSSLKPNQSSVNRPNVPVPNAGAGGGRQAGAVGVAPKRGRGVLNAANLGGARVPLCGQCHSQIRGPFITALGKIWCPDHFACATPSCRRPLQDLGFVEEQGQLYCEYCFEQYLAPPCSKCSAKIKGDCLKAIGKNFHPECFNCVYCGKLFGNSPFFLEDGNPYCDADWNELFTTKCFACGFPVEAGDRWVEALSNNYHSQCFNCTMCKKNLEGQSFFAKGGRPFCKNHAR